MIFLINTEERILYVEYKLRGGSHTLISDVRSMNTIQTKREIKNGN